MAKREQELIELLRAHRPEPPPVAPPPRAKSLFWGLGGGLALASALWMLMTLTPPAQGLLEDPLALEAFVIEAGSALFEGSRSQAGEAYFELLEGLS